MYDFKAGLVIPWSYGTNCASKRIYGAGAGDWRRDKWVFSMIGFYGKVWAGLLWLVVVMHVVRFMHMVLIKD